MKKILVFLISIFLLTGCDENKKIDIDTVINKDNYFSSIEYPIFKDKVLDKKIYETIQAIEKDFLRNQKQNNELNIDFEYQILNERYISILLTATTYLPNKHQTYYTYFFDKEQKNFLNIYEIVEQKKEFLKLVQNEFKKKYGKKLNSNIKLNTFYISEKSINLYISSNRRDYLLQIPLEDIELSFEIKTEELNIPNYTPLEKNVIDMEKPAIALTFDDGPSKYTNEILEILKKNNASATFFVLGNKVNTYQETILKALQNGNEIGNHTYNHKWLSHLEENEIKNQIKKTQEMIQKYIGFTPTLFRPSYGDIPSKIKGEIPLNVILWNVDTLDWKLKNKNTIVKRATSNVKDGDIILMHDTYKRTKEALPTIIKNLQKKGFQLVTISELQEIQKLKRNNE